MIERNLLKFSLFWNGIFIIFPETLKYWVGVQRDQSYLMGEGVSLGLVGHPFSDGFTIKIACGADVLLHRSTSHPIFSSWVA